MIQIFFRKALGGLLATALAAGATLAAAQPASAQYYTVPGAPGVADVSLVQGDVVIVRADSGSQVGAAINTPMLPGDYIATAGGSRAEVQFDGSSMMRLAANTQVRMVNLNPSSREVQLASGTTELAMLQGGYGTSQIDTPSVTVRPDQPGDYRVSVTANGETLVTVRSGVATVSSGNGSQNLTPGTTLVAYGAYDNATVSMQAPLPFDGFDNFNQRRDQAVVASYNANSYLSPGLAGYTNFADYGQWYNVPGYGESWAPSNQGNGWTPYSNGQWVWEPGYGYTWVGNEPWGYAPYHYGNWYYATGYNQWMWQPPAYQYQNSGSSLASAWLPALVAFFMTGGNANAALGTGLNYAFDASNPYGYGNIGWVPLAPGEQYTPWFGGFGANAGFPQTALSPVTNVTNVYNVYRNIRYIKVVRVIPVSRFRDGDFRHAVTMPVSQIARHIAIVRGAVPVVPTRSVLAVKPAATTVRISSRFEQPAFAAKVPATVHEMSFDRQTEALKTVVTAKPRVEPVTVRTTPVEHPVYQAPAERQTFHAPVQVAHPAAASKPVSAPERTTTAPERTTTSPERTAPERTFAPQPQRTATPERITTPERATAPQRTAAPERTFAPAPVQRPVEREVTPPVQRQTAPVERATPVERSAPVDQRPVPARTFAPPAEQRPAPVVKHTATPDQRPQGNPDTPGHPRVKATSTPPPA